MAEDKTFKIMVDDKEHELSIRSPNGADYNEADVIKNRVFYDALQKKLPTMLELEKILKERKIWTEEKEQEVEVIRKEIAEKEILRTKGNMKIIKGKKIALEIKELRQKIRDMVAERTSFYNNTAEGMADNMHFNCLVSRCLVYNKTNKPYFADLDAYVTNSSGTEALWGANRLANIIYSIGREVERGSIENEFLLQFNLVDEDLQLIDSNKHLIDEDGDRINELGYKVDKSGNTIDVLGNARDENGRPIVERKPFLDKSGKAIEIDKKTDEQKDNLDKTEKPDEVKEEVKSAN